MPCAFSWGFPIRWLVDDCIFFESLREPLPRPIYDLSAKNLNRFPPTWWTGNLTAIDKTQRIGKLGVLEVRDSNRTNEVRVLLKFGDWPARCGAHDTDHLAHIANETKCFS